MSKLLDDVKKRAIDNVDSIYFLREDTSAPDKSLYTMHERVFYNEYIPVSYVDTKGNSTFSYKKARLDH